jgi:DNA-binding transcriptional LysR family regulator
MKLADFLFSQDFLYALEVSKLKNITHVAERMHISQSAISMAIKRLEESLGILLFNRMKGIRSITLTHEGEIFFLEMDKIRKLVNDDVTEKFLSKDIFPIKIGVFFHLGRDLLYPALKKLNEDVGSYHCYAVIKNKSILNAVTSGELDCGLLSYANIINSAHFHKIRLEPYSLLGLKSAYPKLDKIKKANELAGYPRAYEYLGEQEEDDFQNIKVIEKAFHASEHFSTREMILAGVLVECLYHNLFTREEKKKLLFSPYKDIDSNRYAFFIWNKNLSEKKLKRIMLIKEKILEASRARQI